MVGAIRRLDILFHPFVTVQCFGWRIFFRALTAGEDETFLSLVAQDDILRPRQAVIHELVDHCIQLELQAKRIYEWLAGRFLGYTSTSEFFDTLARQEETHAELLGLCREAAERSAWKEEWLSEWRDAVPRLERQMDEIEASLPSLEGMSDGLMLVLQIEGSELNQVFSSVVTASETGFVRKLRPFQIATSEHISLICREVPRLEPNLADQCHELEEHCSASPD